jgi:Tfp pilus assembly protein PilV
MLAILLNKKGISIVEALIAIFITGIAAVSILSLQDTSWRTGSKSDYFGRAAGILQTELELRQDQLMRGDMNDPIKVAANPVLNNLGVAQSRSVHVINPLDAAATAITGDKVFTVTTTVTDKCVTTGTPHPYLVNVQVTWPGTAKGIKGSIIVVCPNCPTCS